MPPKLVQISVNNPIRRQWFLTQNASEICQPDPLRELAALSQRSPNFLAGLERPPRRGARERKGRGEGAKEEGISGKEGEGQKRRESIGGKGGHRREWTGHTCSLCPVWNPRSAPVNSNFNPNHIDPNLTLLSTDANPNPGDFNKQVIRVP